MKKSEVVKDNKKFNYIINKGKYIKNNYFVIYIMKSENEKPNFGIAVGTKIGKAFQRNKYKRQIRSIIDNNKFIFPKNNDYIIIMKKACANLKYQEMQKELVSLIESKVK